MGNPGMGKSHLSIALGLLACNEGFKVRFYSAPVLASELVEAQEGHSLIKLQKSLTSSFLMTFRISAFLSNNPNCYFK
jgi:DNA replication protein DnaC